MLSGGSFVGGIVLGRAIRAEGGEFFNADRWGAGYRGRGAYPEARRLRGLTVEDGPWGRPL